MNKETNTACLKMIFKCLKTMDVIYIHTDKGVKSFLVINMIEDLGLFIDEEGHVFPSKEIISMLEGKLWVIEPLRLIDYEKDLEFIVDRYYEVLNNPNIIRDFYKLNK